MPEIRNKDGIAADARSLDIAIVNPRKVNKETRYDVVAVDFTGSHPVIQTRLGKKFLLAEAPVAPSKDAIQAMWLKALSEDPEGFVDTYGADKVVGLAIGVPTEIDGTFYNSLNEFIAAQESDPPFFEVDEVDTEDIEVDTESARDVFRVSTTLAGVLPFLPTVAYPIND